MDYQFSIKSSVSDAEMRFVDPDGYQFTVELSDLSITARKEIWGFQDCQGLVELLEQLSKQKQDWIIPYQWESREHELEMSFTCDSLGHVGVHVKLTSLFCDEKWQVSKTILTELGQLPRIAASASLFFNATESEFQQQ